MQKSVMGKIEGVSTKEILAVPAGQTITDVCLFLNNHDTITGNASVSVDVYHSRLIAVGDADPVVADVKIGVSSFSASKSSTTLVLEGAVFQAGDKLKVTVAGTAADVDVSYLVNYTVTVEGEQMLPVLTLLVRKTLEGLVGKQVCFLDTPILPPTTVPTGPSADASNNANAASLTSEVSFTSTTDWTDILTVTITPSADDKDVRLWLTLLWEGWIAYRIVRGTTAITADLEVGDRESDTGAEPVVFPITNSPASAAQQTYKLQAKKVGGTTKVSVGTTLYVEEIS